MYNYGTTEIANNIDRVRIFESDLASIRSTKNVGEDLKELTRRGLLTYGGMNTDILSPTFKKLGYSPIVDAICPEDDADLELQMPNVWYLNKGDDCMSIPMYYNFLQIKVKAQDGTIHTENQKIIDEYGRVPIIEIYGQGGLETCLQRENYKYFGTEKTLTEPMRILEGWDLTQVPRLNEYVDFANKMEGWIQKNCPFYDPSKWRLGKEKTKLLKKKEGVSNVRECIKYFWQNHLIRKTPKIAPTDIEIDIIDPRFSTQRQPDVVVVGENFLDTKSRLTDSPENIHFDYFSDGRRISFMTLLKNDGTDVKNAQLLTQQYPNAEILVFRNKTDDAKRFKLVKYDEIKSGHNTEVAVVADVLKNI